MNTLGLQQRLEALLFVASEPLSPKQLADHAAATTNDVADALQALSVSLANRGLQLNHHDGRYELVTHPDAADALERYTESETRADLSKPALETLAIIAYKQPITKSAIENIRGVASDQTLKNLLLRGLVVEAGRANEPGKPQLYATSHQFLRQLGLADMSQLPPLPEGADPHEA